MRKNIFVESLRDYLQQEVTDLFFLRKIADESNGTIRYSVVLVDRTGEVKGNVWGENVNPQYLAMENKVVKVTFSVGLHRGLPDVSVKVMEVVKNFVATDFVPSVENPEAQYSAFLKMYTEDITQPHLIKLLDSFYRDDRIAKKLKILQGGKMVHHVKIGGYIEHVASVYMICKSNASLRKEQLNLEVLLTAAALHDIGKIKEYSVLPYNQRTDEGILIGHLSYSLMMVYSAIKDLRSSGIDFPKDDEVKLLHLIATSHGSQQASGLTGSEIVKPSCIEAIILSRADDLDSRIDSYDSIIQADTLPGNFTKYNGLYDQYLYKG